MPLPPRAVRTARALLLSSIVVTTLPSAVGCLDRPVAPSTPRTTNVVTDQLRQSSIDKIDLLFMIDNSASMADKQNVLASAVPDLVDRLINPVCGTTDEAGIFTRLPKDQQPAIGQPCPDGSAPEFKAIADIHIGVVTSSLGGHGADRCDPLRDASAVNKNNDDRAHLLTRGSDSASVPTYRNAQDSETGFFAWDPGSKNDPPGETDSDALKKNFRDVVRGANQNGCGYEASLEAWYRFLIDPSPPDTVRTENGKLTRQTDQGTLFSPVVLQDVDEVLLQQRADFLRPDSLVAVINLSDENDCSILDGTLPRDVCDDPALDDLGNPTGTCLSGRVGWPVGYLEGNAQGYTRTGDRVTGDPYPFNHFAAQISYDDGKSSFVLARPTDACASDPYSPDCRQACYPGTPGCESQLLDKQDDVLNLRCWDQKRRFGVDFLYPLRRYSDGLTQAKVYDRNGNLVQNPLFDDLPFKAAKKAGTPLARPRMEARPGPLVFYASIVGVPWQDIARDPKNLAAGYLPTVPTKKGEAIDWDLILGQPFRLDGPPVPPTDPLMHETRQARSGTHPVTGEVINATSWNSINGHEWSPDTDLQYACIFQLPAADVRSCVNNPTSCDCDIQSQMTDGNPLCEKRDASRKGDGVRSTTQYSAKAYPGTRFLQVARDVGANAIVSSICTPNTTDQTADDFGYRPAVSAIIERLKTQLTERCLPRSLDVNNGVTPCLILDARLLRTSTPPAADEVTRCNACKEVGHRPLDPSIRALLTGNALDYDCLCEVTQIEGAALDACQTKKNAALPADTGGWCYVDPSQEPDPVRQEAERKVVGTCERQIRFLNASVDNTTLFITCLGAASGNEIVTTSATQL